MHNKFRVWLNGWQNEKYLLAGSGVIVKVEKNNVHVTSDDPIIEMWSGMHDVNMAEIYDGDFIVDCDDKTLIGRVTRNSLGEFVCGGNMLSDIRDGEVAGNIHDNPEIMELLHDI